MIPEVMTHEKLRSMGDAKGYCLYNKFSLPDWGKGRHLITLTPELAERIMWYDSLFHRKKVRCHLDNTPIESHIENGTWSTDMQELYFSPSLKCIKGMKLISTVAKLGKTIDIYLNVEDMKGYGWGKENENICLAIKEAVMNLYKQEGKKIPDIELDKWTEAIPKALKEKSLEIYIVPEEYNDVPERYFMLSMPTLITILAEDRSKPYPDRLYIVRTSEQSGKCVGYECNLIPMLGIDINAFTIRPGFYKHAFVVTDLFEGFMQSAPMPLVAPIIDENNKIESLAQTDYDFMRVCIPVQQGEAGLFTVGVKFKNETIQKDFLGAVNLPYIHRNINYVVFEEKDIPNA